ncbi:MAG: tetratricopeptide repeat protein, partial [Muribaculaceae bacterium]|nr:tetratricopeptide repeat protein [Muribaculaceae bacterium]
MKRILLYAIIAVSMVLSSCGGAKMSVADEQMARGEYFDASKTYRKVYNKLTKREERPTRGVAAYKMGECYRQLNMSSRASAAYQNALRYGYPDSMAILYLAQSLHAEGKYAAAKKSYENFLSLNPNSDLAKTGVIGCDLALRYKEKKTRHIVKQAKLFNSRRSDFSPMYQDKTLDVIYYATTNEKVTGTKKSEITGMKKADIWFSKKDEQGQWTRPATVEGELNSELDEGIISFSPDGTTMYLTKARRELHSNTGVEIYTSQRSEAAWSAPVKFEITSDTVSSYGHPAVSPDGEYLYFTSDMPGGFGGKDLWRINLKDRAGSLENLGEFINTEGDEMFPYMRADSVLY